jgi:Flp pilus assembly protein TadD
LALVQTSRSPDNPRFHYHLGMAYAKNGETVQAREQLQRMLRMSPDSNDATDARKELSQLKS